MKKRKDSFFGLHFDMHATEKTLHIGRNFRYDLFRKLLKEVKPDYIQCDAKGHPGIVSYPSEFGASAPEQDKDVLAILRELTQEYDVALYTHYSGVFDSAAVKLHPEWAIVDEKGETSDKFISVFSGYADEKLIPQLKEIAGKYKANGAWVDGECWGCKIDYSDNAKNAFYKKFGRFPDFKKDKKLYIDFCRQGFIEYLKRYENEVRKEHPDFEMTSNWFASSYSPNMDKIPCDFLSGDLTWIDPIENGARFDLKFFLENGMPWDAMSWAFTWFTEDNCNQMQYPKSAIQLMQEASYVISLGGGYQLYFRQSPECGLQDASVITVSKKVAEFCREREEFCRGKKPEKEVAMIFSAKKYYDEIGDVMFTARENYIEDFRYLNNLVMDLGFSTLYETAEKGGELTGYSSVVITDSAMYSDEETSRFLAYAEQGGNLIVSGSNACARIVQRLGLSACIEKGKAFYLKCGETTVKLISDITLFSPEDFDKIEKAFFRREDFFSGEGDGFPVFALKKVGRGIVRFIPFSLGLCYNNRTPSILRDFFSEVVGVSPVVKANSHLVDTVLSYDEKSRFIHLINNGGKHCNCVPKIYDEITPLCNLKISVKSEKKPCKIISEPSGKEIPFVYENGRAEVTLGKLEIYDILRMVY